MKIPYLNLLVFILLTNTIYANKIFVNINSTGEATGDSWANAFTNLHLALDTANEGDTIWIAKGNYFTTNNEDRYISFELKTGVSIYGGFHGNETIIDQRDIEQNETILDGNIGNIGSSEDNSFTVLLISSPDSRNNINGITIKNGNANSQNIIDVFNSPPRNGGGVFIESTGIETFCTFEKCKFVNNFCSRKGGAIFINSQVQGNIDLELIDCLFKGNEAYDGTGIVLLGGIQNCNIERCEFIDNNRINPNVSGASLIDFSLSSNISEIEISDCVFKNNIGGGIRIFENGNNNGLSHKIKIERCNFSENEGMGVSVGSIVSAEDSALGSMKLKNCNFINNLNSGILQCSNVGEALIENCFVENHIGQLFGIGEKIPTAIINNSTFNNVTSNSDLIHLYGSDISINNSIFINTSSRYIVNSSYETNEQKIEINNSVFAENKVGNSSSEILSPCLFKNTGSKIINHCNFINNYADDNFIFEIMGIADISNSIFYNALDQHFPFVVNEVHPIEVKNCLFFGKNCVDIWGEENEYCGENNIFGINPEFQNLNAQQYDLSPCSPAIDKGIETTLENDINQNVRKQGQETDIGAYETSPPKINVVEITPSSCKENNGAVEFTVEGVCDPYSVYHIKEGRKVTTTTELEIGEYLFFVEDAMERKDSLLIKIEHNPDSESYLLVPNLVHPNQRLTLKNCSENAKNLDVIDYSGKTIFSKNKVEGDYTFNAPQVSGTYFIRITEDSQVRQVLTFMVQ